MNKLLIQHLAENDETGQATGSPRFQVVRLSDGKSAGPVEVPAPVGYPVQGMPTSHLMKELPWYLEIFLGHPYPPFTEQAERILAALHAWGTEAFAALFHSGPAGRLFDEAVRADHSRLHLEISSDDHRVLAWPWEALQDAEAGVLSRTSRISRRLNKVRDPYPVSHDLPRDRVNILLVTARPYESDVRFRSVSRPLVDLVDRENLPASVTLLRPPTLNQLRGHLHQHPDHYHILHFDGHGSYRPRTGSGDSSGWTFQGPQGQLIFEDDAGQPDPQPAAVLSELLREHRIPVAVLNACSSGAQDVHAEDAFASVAADLQRAGVRSVVAMAYALYVSAARQFLPAFYRRLFESGSVSEALRVGRQQMFASPQRVSPPGKFPLQDWLVPVLYEQDPVDLSFAATAVRSSPEEDRELPEAALDPRNPHGLVGRDGALLQMERALQRPPAGILLCGMGGIGKTTLAGGFVRWLQATAGLPGGCFWFSFQGISSAEFVINDLTGKLLGTAAMARPLPRKIADLARMLRQQRHLIVWDNFEVVQGIEGTALEPALGETDQQQLLDFLRALRDGASKIIITSRGEEDWIKPADCFQLSLGGLYGEERWEYCDAIVRDLGLTVDRGREDWKKLIDSLDGHPLAMRVILSGLREKSPEQLLTAIESNLRQFESQDEESARLFASLQFVRDELPAELKRLLIPVSFHERYIVADDLKAMAGRVEDDYPESDIDRLLKALTIAGVTRHRGNGVYELHPALVRYLKFSLDPENGDRIAERDQWRREFVVEMAGKSGYFDPGKPHLQRGVLFIHGSNLRNAVVAAEQLEMLNEQGVLTETLAIAAFNTRDFSTAESWYRKSLAIEEQQGNEHGAASTYHQLGMIAQEQRDFSTAESWYRKSLAISERQGNEHGAARTYHQLGRIAQEQRDFSTAESWYRKSLAIEERQGNEHGAAITYHQLGRIAEERGELSQAAQWVLKSLRIFVQSDSPGNAEIATRSFRRIYAAADEATQKTLRQQWKQADIGPFPDQPE